jgi:hypothetical protein
MHDAQLTPQWTHFERPFQLVSQWDCPRGILFIARDASSDQAVETALELLAPEKTYRLEGQTPAQWREETALLAAKEHQESLLEPAPRKICIVALHLDEFSEEYHATLKGLFERSNHPFCCLASATGPQRIPDYLRSHFFECRRLGVPRQHQEDDKSPLP